MKTIKAIFCGLIVGLATLQPINAINTEAANITSMYKTGLLTTSVIALVGTLSSYFTGKATLMAAQKCLKEASLGKVLKTASFGYATYVLAKLAFDSGSEALRLYTQIQSQS